MISLPKSNIFVALISSILLSKHLFISFHLSFSSTPNSTVLWAHWHNLWILPPFHPPSSPTYVYECFFIQVRFYHWALNLYFRYLLNFLTYLIVSYLPGKIPILVKYFSPLMFFLSLHSKHRWSNTQNQALWSCFVFLTSNLEWALSVAEPSSVLP